MSSNSENIKSIYTECLEAYVDYEENIISQRHEYASIQLTIFLYTILGSFLVHANRHLVLPINSGLLCFFVLFFGLIFYVSVFNVNMLVERRWQIGVSSAVREVRNVLGVNYDYSYSVDSGFMELILLVTLIALVIFTFLHLFTTYFISSIFAILSSVITFVFLKRHIKHPIKPTKNLPRHDLQHLKIADIKTAWELQKHLIRRICFVHKSLNTVRKALLVSFMVYIGMLTFDVFTKKPEITLSNLESYALLSALLFQIVILAIWDYDMLETQSNANVIFKKGMELEQATPGLPSLWHNMLDVLSHQSENVVLWHMSNLYFLPLIMSQIIGLMLILSSSYKTDLKVSASVLSCIFAVTASFMILRKTLKKK